MAPWDAVLCWEGPKTFKLKVPVTYRVEHKNKISTSLPPGNPKNCQQSHSFLNWLMSSGSVGVWLKGASYFIRRNEVKLALVGKKKKETKKERGGEKQCHWNLIVIKATLIANTSGFLPEDWSFHSYKGYQSKAFYTPTWNYLSLRRLL